VLIVGQATVRPSRAGTTSVWADWRSEKKMTTGELVGVLACSLERSSRPGFQNQDRSKPQSPRSGKLREARRECRAGRESWRQKTRKKKNTNWML